MPSPLEVQNQELFKENDKLKERIKKLEVQIQSMTYGDTNVHQLVEDHPHYIEEVKDAVSTVSHNLEVLTDHFRYLAHAIEEMKQ